MKCIAKQPINDLLVLNKLPYRQCINISEFKAEIILQPAVYPEVMQMFTRICVESSQAYTPEGTGMSVQPYSLLIF